MGIVIAGIILAVAIYVVRFMGQRGIFWIIVPANCYVNVTTWANKTGDMTKGGGGITDVLHNVPGKKIEKTSPDQMQWNFVKGRERRGLLFLLFGMQWIGPFRTLRTNVIRRFRYSKKRGAAGSTTSVGNPMEDYEVQHDDLTTRFVPYSGDQAILINDAETKDVFELNFLLNIVEENVYPVRAIRVSDPNAILAGMIKEQVNAVTGQEKPEYFIKASAESTKKIVDAAMTATVDSEEEIGKRIDRVTLVETGMDPNDRKLFELEAETTRKNAAAIAEANKNKEIAIIDAAGYEEAQMKRNVADADRVKTVMLPMAESDRTVAVRKWEAYENNETITTHVEGGNVVLPVATK